MNFAPAPVVSPTEACTPCSTVATRDVPDSAVVRLGYYVSDDRLRRDLARAIQQPERATVTAEWNGVPLILNVTPMPTPCRVLCDEHAAVVVVDSRLSKQERGDHVHSAIDYIQHLRARFGRL